MDRVRFRRSLWTGLRCFGPVSCIGQLTAWSSAIQTERSCRLVSVDPICQGGSYSLRLCVYGRRLERPDESVINGKRNERDCKAVTIHDQPYTIHYTPYAVRRKAKAMADVLRDCVPPNVCSNACRSLSLLSRSRLPVTVRQRPRLASRPHPTKRACLQDKKGTSAGVAGGNFLNSLARARSRARATSQHSASGGRQEGTVTHPLSTRGQDVSGTLDSMVVPLASAPIDDHGPLWPRLESHSIWLPEGLQGLRSRILVASRNLDTWTSPQGSPSKTVTVDSDLVRARTRPGDR